MQDAQGEIICVNKIVVVKDRFVNTSINLRLWQRLNRIRR